MFVDCACGARNSAFNPTCQVCGAPVVESRSACTSGADGVASVRLARGATVGAYTIEEAIGEGSIGRVFVAATATGERVALKALHPHLLSSDDARRRFLREADALREVRHPSVGALLDAFEHDGVPVLVLELVAGRSLRHWLDNAGSLPLAVALGALEQVTNALGALHEAGWVHRDVKPENVMLLGLEPTRVKLLDFGLARALSPRTGDVRTAAGAFVGSLAYAAPEQVLGQDIGPAADWWSVGVVAYELLCGVRPFVGERRRALVAQILAASPPPIRGIPEALDRGIRGLFVLDPTARPGFEAVRSIWCSAGAA